MTTRLDSIKQRLAAAKAILRNERPSVAPRLQAIVLISEVEQDIELLSPAVEVLQDYFTFSHFDREAIGKWEKRAADVLAALDAPEDAEEG